MDWSQLSMLMEKYGGVSAFGSWQDWGGPFDLKQLQEKWDGKAFHDVMSALEKHKAQVEKANLRPYMIIAFLDKIAVKPC